MSKRVVSIGVVCVLLWCGFILLHWAFYENEKEVESMIHLTTHGFGPSYCAVSEWGARKSGDGYLYLPALEELAARVDRDQACPKCLKIMDGLVVRKKERKKVG